MWKWKGRFPKAWIKHTCCVSNNANCHAKSYHELKWDFSTTRISLRKSAQIPDFWILSSLRHGISLSAQLFLRYRRHVKRIYPDFLLLALEITHTRSFDLPSSHTCVYVHMRICYMRICVSNTYSCPFVSVTTHLLRFPCALARNCRAHVLYFELAHSRHMQLLRWLHARTRYTHVTPRACAHPLHVLSSFFTCACTRIPVTWDARMHPLHAPLSFSTCARTRPFFVV